MIMVFKYAVTLTLFASLLAASVSFTDGQTVRKDFVVENFTKQMDARGIFTPLFEIPIDTLPVWIRLRFIYHNWGTSSNTPFQFRFQTHSDQPHTLYNFTVSSGIITIPNIDPSKQPLKQEFHQWINKTRNSIPVINFFNLTTKGQLLSDGWYDKNKDTFRVNLEFTYSDGKEP